MRIVGSPFASNEALGALLRLGHAVGTVTQSVFRSRRAEDEDPLPGFRLLVRRRDLAPNVDGVGILGFERAGADDSTGGLEEAANHDGILLVLGDELGDQAEDFGADAGLYVYLGTFDSPAARNADFILPLTTFAEEDGTFVNAQGRVQRFWQGLQPPGSARPAWLVLGALVAALEGGETPASAADAFAALAAEEAAFAGLSYDAIGSAGAALETAHA